MLKPVHTFLLCLLVLGSAPTARGQGASPPTTDVGFGVPIYPGAEPRSDLAAAVEAYYRPELVDGQRIDAAVYVSPAPFEEVHDFFGPRMERGKWGWRKKSHPLRHQTLTLAFMRARLAERAARNQESIAVGAPPASSPEASYPGELEPFFGGADVPQEEFETSLEVLARAHPDAEIAIVEGVRRIQGDPEGGMVRIVVERPYVDLAQMALVDATRITLIKVADVR